MGYSVLEGSHWFLQSQCSTPQPPSTGVRQAWLLKQRITSSLGQSPELTQHPTPSLAWLPFLIKGKKAPYVLLILCFSPRAQRTQPSEWPFPCGPSSYNFFELSHILPFSCQKEWPTSHSHFSLNLTRVNIAFLPKLNQNQGNGRGVEM